MTASSTLTPDSAIDRIFGPVVEARTYRHLLYEFISFPFGLFSFVLTVTGLATGIGLAAIVVGFVILALTLALARWFAGAERRLARALLDASFDTLETRPALRAGLADHRSWTAAAYFVLRLPLAIMGFVAAILLSSSTLLVATPFLYPVLPVMVGGVRVTTSEEAMLVSLAGCVLFLLCAHAINGLAAVSRRLAVALL